MKAKYIAGLAAALIIAGAAAAPGIPGCGPKNRRSPPSQPQPETQTYRINKGGNVVAQIAETIEVEADIRIGNAVVRSKATLAPGTWLLPESMFAAPGQTTALCAENAECRAVAR